MTFEAPKRRAADAVAQALVEFALLFRPQSGGDG
jgi:hypothetical protein